MIFVKLKPDLTPILRIALTAMILLSVCVSTGYAQSAGRVEISKPDLSQYPQINLTFRPVNASGEFIKDLQAINVDVIENGQKLSANSLELVNSGVQFTVAVNEGPTLANRYSGVSRFERIKTALYTWISAHDSQTMDEFRLVTNQGSVNFSRTDPADWSKAIEAYQPDLRNLQPGLASLTSAVDGVISEGNLTGKPMVILYITPLPAADQFDELEGIFTRADENGIHIFVWLIGPKEYATADSALKLNALAEQTDGKFFLFTGSEELPILSDLLDPLAYLYRLSYKTFLNTSGDYSLGIKIEKDQTILESEEVTFSLKVAAPNPIFLSPPTEITRSWTETKRKRDSVLTPDNAMIQIMVEFPDGMERDLTYSRLFIDNMLVSENTSEPFNTFTWNISKLTESGSHTMQVTIEDVAGLQGETIIIPVDIIVLEQPKTLLERIFAHVNIVNGIIGGVLILLLAGGITALIRILKKKPRKMVRKPSIDPLTQPVEINGEYSLAPSVAEQRIEWPVIRGSGLAAARLLRKGSSAQDALQPQEIALSGEEVSIGSERKKVDIILTHDTVSGVHARIFKDAEGNFRVADLGSNAGTWVNYAPVSSHGARLEHGDLVQFGRVSYIFEVHGAVPKRVQVLPYRED